jgi:hypothetical protein
MIKQDITYQEKLNELRLDISHPNSNGKVFVLVEGESDIRLFRKFFNLQNCKVESIPGGNAKLEKCVNELVTVYALVIGIRDADFLHLRTVPYSNTNMFLTDYHDIEMTLVSEDTVFSALVFEYTNIPPADHAAIRSDIIKSIEQLSLLKWLNYKKNLKIVFSKTGFQDLISFTNLKIDFAQYFQRLLSQSPNAKITDVKIILSEMKKLKKLKPQSFQLCNGHDFMKAFSQFIRKKGKAKNITDEQISSAVRMIFNHDSLAKTLLYANTKNWADSNNCSIYI